jgi:predicted DNA-binding mobile mystery protein A
MKTGCNLMKSNIRQRARQRLDERLALLKPESRFAPPPKGWIRAIRDALSMTGSQLAARLEVKPQTVLDIEKSEETDSIQLKTLRRAAEALDCTLVYALVPKTSLEAAVQTRARRIAIKDLQRVAQTMKLENQSIDDAALEERIAAYIRDVIKDRNLWTGRD